MRSVWTARAILALTVAAVVAGFYLSRRIPVKERFTGRRRLWYAGYLIARWKRYVLRKLSLDSAEESYFRELYVNEHPGLPQRGFGPLSVRRPEPVLQP